MPALSTVVLSIKGDARKAMLQLSANELTMEILQKYFKKKDTPELILTQSVDQMYLHVFGYKKGKKGTENKSTIPALSNETTVFGDAMVIATLQPTWNHPIPFTVDQWSRVLGKQKTVTKIREEDDLDEPEEEEEEEDEEEEHEDEIDEVENDEEELDDEEYSEESETEAVLSEKEELEVSVGRRRCQPVCGYQFSQG